MSEIKWLGTNQIKVDPPKHPKKITGTRLGAILGLNKWNSEFKTWCEITRTYQEPFEDTIYTIAGKIIEPKQAEYMKTFYYMTGLKTPTELYGKDYFNKTYGDFFHDKPRFGGMWDYLLYDDEGNVKAVLEMKTTKRSEDWSHGIPEYYSLQASLYAYLLGVDKVYMVCSFLQDSDYEHPEDFVPQASNTLVLPFNVSEKYPDFETEYIGKAETWWKTYVESGISPVYSEITDADILKELRKKTVDTSTADTQDLIAEAEQLKEEIDANALAIKEKTDRYDAIMKSFKQENQNAFADRNIKQVAINGSKLVWTISRQEKTELDTDAMKADGIYEKYFTKKKETFVLRCAKQEG